MLEEQKPDSPYVYLKWRATTTTPGSHHGVAMEYWTFFFRIEGGKTTVILGPPHSEVLQVPYQPGEYWGLLLKAHIFMPNLTKRALPPEGLILPLADKSHFVFAGQKISIPTFETAEVFAEDLVKRNLILAHPLVAKALEGKAAWSERTAQRHMLNIVGLTRRDLQRIRRARHAYALLQEGKSIVEVAALAGYTDQAHLTKSLKILAGQTPAEILAAYKNQQ